MKKGKIDISNSLLDNILKEARKTKYISIDDFLNEKGYDKSLSRMIRDKLIKDGGYVRKRIKEYIPPTTALIGCITV